MADQQAYKKTIFSTPGFPVMGHIAGGKDYQVIVDPYSGKYYGEAAPSTFINHFQNQILSIQDTLARGYSVVQEALGINNWTTSKRVPIDQATRDSFNKQLADAQAEIAKFSGSGYEQKTDMMKSFDQYGGDWNNYFRGSYVNPRLTEEQQNRVARMQQQQGSEGQQSLSIPFAQEQQVASKTTSPTTGLAKGEATSNPFVYRESGLNI